MQFKDPNAGMTFAIYSELSQRKREAVEDHFYILNEPEMLDEACRRLGADWILIVAGEIIKYGPSGTQPLDEELREIGKEHDRIPYLIHRTVHTAKNRYRST